MRYQIIIRDKSGNELGEFTEWQSLRFNDKLNNYGSCSFYVPVTSQELLSLVSLRRYETIIKRDGQIVWAGEQANRHVSLQRNSANLVEIISFTFLEMLNSRYTPAFVRYDATDQGEILQDLVEDSQAVTDGDLGFTFGTVETTVNRDREYYTQNIMEAYINMSNVIDGPDFYITHDKEINIVAHKGIDKSRTVIFEWGTNIESVDIDDNFSNPCNQALVLGAGFGSNQGIGTFTDATVRGIYKLRQQRVSEIDVSDQDTLDAKAEALVRKYKTPLMSLDMVQLPNKLPNFGTFALGDTGQVRIQHGIYNIDNRFRNYGYNVSVSKDNKESISYIVGLI